MQHYQGAQFRPESSASQVAGFVAPPPTGNTSKTISLNKADEALGPSDCCYDCSYGSSCDIQL